jgi:tetratricopeptide (TPR) repeat protein
MILSWVDAMSSSVATNFRDAYNKLRLELITKEDFETYYVPREDSPVVELRERILMDDAPSKSLFTGLRASGKTTELRRLMFTLRDDYFVVYFSTMKELSLVDIDYKDVLLSMVLQTLRAVEERGVDVSGDIVKDMYLLLKQISGEFVVSRVEKKTRGFDVGGMLRALVVDVGGRYKSEVETRKEIRAKTEYLVQDLIQRFNLLIEELRLKVGKPLLIIVDDLEKADLELAERIFYKHAPTLAQPNCKVIFTIPVSLVYAPPWKQIEMNFLTPPCFLPLKEVKTKEGEEDRDGIDFLKNVVLKRVSSELFEDRALEMLAKWSGGVVVDFLRMVWDCCVKAQAGSLERVNENVAGECFDSLVNDFWRARTKVADFMPREEMMVQSLEQLARMPVFYKNLADIRRRERIHERLLKSLDPNSAKDGHSYAAIALSLGFLKYIQGNHDGAYRLYEQSLKIKRELGAKPGISKSLHNLAVIEQARGNYDKARELYEQSLKIVRELGDKPGIATSMNAFGTLCEKQERFEDALRHFVQAAYLFHQLGSPREKLTLNDIARTAKRISKKKLNKILEETPDEIKAYLIQITQKTRKNHKTKDKTTTTKGDKNPTKPNS